MKMIYVKDIKIMYKLLCLFLTSIFTASITAQENSFPDLEFSCNNIIYFDSLSSKTKIHGYNIKKIDSVSININRKRNIKFCNNIVALVPNPKYKTMAIFTGSETSLDNPKQYVPDSLFFYNFSTGKLKKYDHKNWYFRTMHLWSREGNYFWFQHYRNFKISIITTNTLEYYRTNKKVTVYHVNIPSSEGRRSSGNYEFLAWKNDNELYFVNDRNNTYKIYLYNILKQNSEEIWSGTYEIFKNNISKIRK